VWSCFWKKHEAAKQRNINATTSTIKAMKLEPRRREGSRRRRRKRCGGGKWSSENTTFLY